MRNNFIILAVTALLTGSCGVYTKYDKTEEVPANLYGEGVTDTDSVGIAGLPWREFFTDAQLQSLIDSALRQNTDLLSAQLKVEEAEATLLSARLAYLPSFAISPQGNVQSFDKQKAVQTYTLPVTASWEVDLSGKLRNAKQQSKALLAKSHDHRQAVQARLIAGVANNYYTLLMLDEQLSITRATEQSWAETVEAMRALVDAGQANAVAVQQMEASLAGVRASALDLEEQINQSENAMALLLGDTPARIPRSTLAAQSFSAAVTTVGVPVSLLAARPDVRAAERGMEQAFYAVNAARSAFYPSVTLTGSAGWSNSSGIQISNPAKFLVSAVASLTQPLFARGQLVGQLMISKAQQEEAQLQFRQTLLNAGVEVNDALTSYQNAKRKTDLYAQQVASLEQAYDNTRLLMEHGNTTYLEVLTAQQSLLAARLSQTANRLTELQAAVSLYHALGGGAD